MASVCTCLVARWCFAWKMLSLLWHLRDSCSGNLEREFPATSEVTAHSSATDQPCPLDGPTVSARLASGTLLRTNNCAVARPSAGAPVPAAHLCTPFTKGRRPGRRRPESAGPTPSLHVNDARALAQVLAPATSELCSKDGRAKAGVPSAVYGSRTRCRLFLGRGRAIEKTKRHGKPSRHKPTLIEFCRCHRVRVDQVTRTIQRHP